MPSTERVSNGPYLAAAFFCERVIEDKEGVLSVIRIVDRVVASVIGSGTPEVMPPTAVQLYFVVMLKSGEAKGRHELRLDVESPDGLRHAAAQEMSVLLEGEDRGANVISQVQWVAQTEGLYWWIVVLGTSELTRVPMRVVYMRQETGPTPQTPA